MALQKVCGVLTDLQISPAYKRLMEEGLDTQFSAFRLEVEETLRHCLSDNPKASTVNEVRRRLRALKSDCVDTLAQFAPYIDRAKSTLDLGTRSAGSTP
jgi:hypothetical protein